MDPEGSSFLPPVEVLPDLRHDLPGDDLHLHGLVGPHSRTFGAEYVVIRDGPHVYISICMVLPEILSHPHSPFLLTTEDGREVKGQRVATKTLIWE